MRCATCYHEDKEKLALIAGLCIAGTLVMALWMTERVLPTPLESYKYNHDANPSISEHNFLSRRKGFLEIYVSIFGALGFFQSPFLISYCPSP